MKTKIMKLKDLKPADYNPRINLKEENPDEFEKLKRSIEEFGYVEPIIYNKKTKHIVGGHQRFSVLEELGVEEVVVVEIDMNQTKEKALNIALNKIHGEWDETKLKALLHDLKDSEFDLELTGFDADALGDLFEDELEDLDEDADEEEVEVHEEIYSKDEIFANALDYFRHSGFPYPQLEIFQSKQELNKLRNLSQEKLKSSRLGYRVADTYHKHRFEGHALNMKSPKESFENDEDLLKVFHFEYPNIKPDFMGFMSLVNGTQSNSNFRPAFVKYLLDKYGVDHDIYLDPCMGYGGRIVGFLASDYQKYIGTDPSIRSFKANHQIIDELGKHKEFDIHNLPFEDLALDSYREKVDIAFTSPPYFNKEVYDGNNKKQSMNKYKEYDAWRDSFLHVLIKKVYGCLKQDRYFILNIEDIKQGKKTFPLVDDSIKIAEEIGFTYQGTEEFKLPKRTRIENDQKIEVEAFESVLIFFKGGE